MSIEQDLSSIAASLAIIATAMAAGGTAKPAAAAAADKPKADKPAAAPKPKTPVHTREELSALAGEYKELTSIDDAKALIKKLGKVEKLKELPEGQIDAMFDGLTAEIETAKAAKEAADDEV